jgi:hypothetical protein
MHFIEFQGFLVQRRRPADAAEFPRRHVHEVLVVSQRFAVGGLAFLAEMTAARFMAV